MTRRPSGCGTGSWRCACGAPDRLETQDIDVDALPDLAGDALIFEFDAEKVDDEHWYVVRHDGRELWRELSAWEDWPRFNAIKDLLKARYGSQFHRIEPTQAAETSLLGDSISAISKLEFS